MRRGDQAARMRLRRRKPNYSANMEQTKTEDGDYEDD